MPPNRGRLWLGPCSHSAEQLVVRYGIDDLHFHAVLWYQDVDLRALETRIGTERFRRLAFHIAAFEANKALSFGPSTFDAGPYADLVTPAFAALWGEIADRVWAQWRYEHGITDRRRPALDLVVPTSPAPDPIEVEPGDASVLLLSGGGKDSLVAMRLLERAGVSYSTLGYAASTYGASAPQHALLDGLVSHGAGRRHHRQWVADDLLDAPVPHLRPALGVRTVTAAETPASVFGALPYALAHGYRTIAVGHERSADAANLVWDATGEAVNHQWGKSLEAERLLQGYLREHLADVTYASVLKPLHDVVIFADLDRHLDAVAATHSCNVRKPWCERCAKCAYVWLGYQAYLPVGAWQQMFATNLADEQANDVHWQQMLGLGDHSPFECVGEVGEARLAFRLAIDAGLRGAAVDRYGDVVTDLDVAERVASYATTDLDHHALPSALAGTLVPELAAMAERAARRFGVA